MPPHYSLMQVFTLVTNSMLTFFWFLHQEGFLDLNQNCPHCQNTTLLTARGRLIDGYCLRCTNVHCRKRTSIRLNSEFFLEFPRTPIQDLFVLLILFNDQLGFQSLVRFNEWKKCQFGGESN